jgi:hypothetical protein
LYFPFYCRYKQISGCDDKTNVDTPKYCKLKTKFDWMVVNSGLQQALAGRSLTGVESGHLICAFFEVL